MRVKFVPPSVDTYVQYYKEQTGNGVFRGARYQRGDGLGSLFATITRFITPLVKPALATLRKGGLRFVSEMASGQNFKSAAKAGLREAGSDLLKRAHTRLQEGKGIKRKRRLPVLHKVNKRCRVKDVFSS